jgi:hypothetical protein
MIALRMSHSRHQELRDKLFGQLQFTSGVALESSLSLYLCFGKAAVQLSIRPERGTRRVDMENTLPR